MNIKVDIDAKVLSSFIKAFPRATNDSINVFKDKVGFKLSADSKRIAPAITGNLRRQIFYYRGVHGANLMAYANYSDKVHGKPFYTFKSLMTKKGRARKITPFFTEAISKNDAFIQKESDAILKRVLK